MATGESSRARADEIYERVRSDAYEELERRKRALGFSGLLAGFTLGATVMVYAFALVSIEGSAGKVVAGLLYPVGYVAAILGRAQLFTENTLYPVLVSFEDRRCVGPTLRLWAVVLAANVLGSLLFALVAVQSPALPPEVADKVRSLGESAVTAATWETFWAAVLAGWLLALVAWLVEAVQSGVGVVVVIWLLTMVVGMLELDHSVATTVQAWAALLEGDVSAGPSLGWWGMTLLGNVVGGVFIVSVVNYGQVHAGRE